MANMLTLVEVANSHHVLGDKVKWPIKRVLTPSSEENMKVLQSTLKALGIRHQVNNGELHVLLTCTEELNSFAKLYFPYLFQSQLSVAQRKDKKIRRTFSEVVAGVHPQPNTILARKAIEEITHRLQNCGVKL